MKNIKISIIIPIYNVEKYLSKCIESVINQSYSNLEIIMVDDGSTDKSLEIAKGYAKEDKRIILLEKTNGGLSSARNYGLEKVTGDYVMFLDSDDWLDESATKYLVEKITSKNYDIIEFGYKYVYDDSNLNKDIKYNEKTIIESNLILDDYFFNNNISDIVCNKIYNYDLMKNIKFVEGKIHEDYMFTPEILNKANTLFISSEVLYYYYQRKNSITNKDFSQKNMDKIFVADYVVNYFAKNNIKYIIPSKIRGAFACITLYMYLLESTNLNKNHKKNFCRIITNKFNEYYKDFINSSEFKKIPRVKQAYLKMFKINKKITCNIYKRIKRK